MGTEAVRGPENPTEAVRSTKRFRETEADNIHQFHHLTRRHAKWESTLRWIRARRLPRNYLATSAASRAALSATLFACHACCVRAPVSVVQQGRRIQQVVAVLWATTSSKMAMDLLEKRQNQ